MRGVRKIKEQEASLKTKEDGKPKEQRKFFADYSKDEENRKLVNELMSKINQKPHGGPILFKELVAFALKKLTPEDLEKLQMLSLGDMDKVNLRLEEYNTKNGTNLGLGEFLVMQLKL